MRSIKDIIKEIDAGGYDRLLVRLYRGKKDIPGDGFVHGEDLQPEKARIKNLLDNFMNSFNRGEDTGICLVSSPGRAEIIGNHMDHQGGCVLTGTLTLDMLGAAAANNEDKVRIISEGFEDIVIDLADGESATSGSHLQVKKEEYNTTAALVKGIIRKIRDLGYKTSGFDLLVDSQVPVGAGLSSSAAFEMLTGVILNTLFCGGGLSADTLAMAGQYAENVYFGKACGRMDQLACGLGGVEYIDFEKYESPIHERLDFSFEAEGYKLCMIDTGTEHSGLSGEFDAIPGEMCQAAGVFGKKRLCGVQEEEFVASAERVREECGDRAFLRGLHFFGERNRVRELAEHLKKNREKDENQICLMEAFLKAVSASGRSSFMYLQNVDTYRRPEREPVAVALALAEYLLKGEGACRIHGGGFAGSILVIIPEDGYAEFSKRMDDVFGKGSCRELHIREEGTCGIV